MAGIGWKKGGRRGRKGIFDINQLTVRRFYHSINVSIKFNLYRRPRTTVHRSETVLRRRVRVRCVTILKRTHVVANKTMTNPPLSLIIISSKTKRTWCVRRRLCPAVGSRRGGGLINDFTNNTHTNTHAHWMKTGFPRCRQPSISKLVFPCVRVCIDIDGRYCHLSLSPSSSSTMTRPRTC